MDFKFLFTSFSGRIGRKEYWLGILALIVASFILIFALGMAFSFFLPIPLISLIGTIIIFCPAIAMGVKRLHDRNKSANPWAYIFFGPGILMQLMQITGFGYNSSLIAGEVVTMPSNGLIRILSIVGGIIGLWAFIELGFLKGTDGENKFGPNPLAK